MKRFVTAYAMVTSSNCVVGRRVAQRVMNSTINHIVWRTARSFATKSPLLLSLSFSFSTRTRNLGGGGVGNVGGVGDVSGSSEASWSGDDEGAAANNSRNWGWESAVISRMSSSVHTAARPLSLVFRESTKPPMSKKYEWVDSQPSSNKCLVTSPEFHRPLQHTFKLNLVFQHLRLV